MGVEFIFRRLRVASWRRPVFQMDFRANGFRLGFKWISFRLRVKSPPGAGLFFKWIFVRGCRDSWSVRGRRNRNGFCDGYLGMNIWQLNFIPAYLFNITKQCDIHIWKRTAHYGHWFPKKIPPRAMHPFCLALKRLWKKSPPWRPGATLQSQTPCGLALL